MKRQGVFVLPPGWVSSQSLGYLPPFNSPLPIHSFAWVKIHIVRVKSLAREHNTMSPVFFMQCNITCCCKLLLSIRLFICFPKLVRSRELGMGQIPLFSAQTSSIIRLKKSYVIFNLHSVEMTQLVTNW